MDADVFASELRRLRESMLQFASDFPEIGSALGISSGASVDPQTERLLNAIAFMSADLRCFISDKSLDVHKFVLKGMCGDLLRQSPACSVLQLCDLGDGRFHVPRGAVFRCGDAVCGSLYDADVSGCSIDSVHVSGGCLRFVLRGNFDSDRVMFHLFCNDVRKCLNLYASIRDANFALCGGVRRNLRWMGYERGDSIVPLMGYTCLPLFLFRDFCCFWQKFMFFCIDGVESKDGVVDIAIPCDDVLSSSDVFDGCVVANCIPVTNTYAELSDPIRVDWMLEKFSFGCDSILCCEKMTAQDVNGGNERVVQNFFDCRDGVGRDLVFMESGVNDDFFILGERTDDCILYGDLVRMSLPCMDIAIGSFFDADVLELGGGRAKSLYLFEKVDFSCDMLLLLRLCCLLRCGVDVGVLLHALSDAFGNKRVTSCIDCLTVADVTRRSARVGLPARFVEVEEISLDVRHGSDDFVPLFCSVLSRFLLLNGDINTLVRVNAR